MLCGKNHLLEFTTTDKKNIAAGNVYYPQLPFYLVAIHFLILPSYKTYAFPRLYWKSYNVSTRAAEKEIQTR